MPRPKKVTVENIQHVLKKMKQMKIHQQKKIKITEKSDGQIIYHYPSITKAKVARALKCAPDYLTSIKDKKIVDALKYVGQKRATKVEIEKDGPNPNTKEYLKLQIKRQTKQIEKLKNDLKRSRLTTYRARTVEKLHNNLTIELESSTATIRRLNHEILELKSLNKSQRTEIAILNSKLTLLEKI